MLCYIYVYMDKCIARIVLHYYTHSSSGVYNRNECVIPLLGNKNT